MHDSKSKTNIIVYCWNALYCFCKKLFRIKPKEKESEVNKNDIKIISCKIKTIKKR